MRPYYDIEIEGLKRRLPLLQVAPNAHIAVLNTLGDTALVEAAAQALGQKLGGIEYTVLVTAEAKSIPLIHALSVTTGKPYVVLRKNYKPYMGDVIHSESHSITTGTKQTLLLDHKDKDLLAGAPVALIDDVISSGSTLQAMRDIVAKAGARVAAEAAIATEGQGGDWASVTSLIHLPVFGNERN